MQTTKDEKYRGLHKQLGEKFGINEVTVYKIRSLRGKGFSFEEIKDFSNKKIDSGQQEMKNMINNLKIYQEVIDTLNNFSSINLEELVEAVEVATPAVRKK